MRTLTHSGSGPVHFDLEADTVTVIEVYAEKRRTAEVRLEPVDSRDAEAAELIEQATGQSRGKRFTVRVPRGCGVVTGSVVIQNGPGSVSFSGGTVFAAAQTIVNGRVVSSSGTTVLTGSGGIRATVRLPLGSELVVTTQSGDVRTHGPLPRVETTSVSGDVTLDRAGVAEVHTTSGDVRITRADRVHANAVSGDVRVRELAERADVRTVSGDIAVHAVRASTVRARAVSGDISVTADAGIEVDSDTRTVSGRTRNRRW